MTSGSEEAVRLAAVVAILHPVTGTVESSRRASVLLAVDHAIDVLRAHQDYVAVVVVGEDQDSFTITDRAAALARAMAKPGLFLTLAAQDIVRDRIMADARFEDFGIFGSEDLPRAERLFAVIHPDLPEPEPPQRQVSGNCPRLNRSFIGRHHERDELQELILHYPLVTITGPPGVGKTSTAIHVARSFSDEYTDGVWWFSVDDRTSLDELLQAISTERGLLALGGPFTVERVAQNLRSKNAIIVLDGCESKAAEIATLCRAVFEGGNASITFLLTSTRPIEAAKEYVYRLQPMSLPREGEDGEDALIASEALALFYERATQTGVRLPLDEETVEIVSTICERVDGLPMAIEIVAASLRTSSLRKLAKNLLLDLGDQFRRSQGVADALEMSYGILSADEKDLLSRLALFRSEWTDEVTSQIWAGRFSAEQIAALHKVLVDSSWISYSPDRDAYRMLHTVRSFCWSKVADGGVMLSNYCTGTAELAAQILKGLQGRAGAEWELSLTRHYSDFVFAMELSLQHAELTPVASALMTSMVHIWLRRNLLDDAERLSNEYLLQGPGGMNEARALVMIGVVHLRRGNGRPAEQALVRCLEITRTEGNRLAEASTLINLGVAMKQQSAHKEARRYYEEALEILTEVVHPDLRCQALSNAADNERLFASTAPARTAAKALKQAKIYAAEALSLVDSVDAVKAHAALNVNGTLALAVGNLEEAQNYLMKAIAVCVRHNLRHEGGEATQALAEINLALGRGPTAAKLLGLSAQIRLESGAPRSEAEAEQMGNLKTRLLGQVDPSRAEKLIRYGQKLDLAEILTPTIFNV